MKKKMDRGSKYSLTGKTALVTGSARRIGKEVAVRLVKAGCKIIVHYNRSSKDADDLVKSIEQNGGIAWKIQADLSETREISSLISRVTANTGTLDILINNASIFPESRLKTVPLEDILNVLTVNSFAPLVLAQSFAGQTANGVIINILDTVISGYAREHAAYQMSKNMLADLTKMMAVDFAPHIRVNAVAPGIILPPGGKDAKYLESLKHRNLLHTIGDISHVADTILFLILNEFITGQIIYVDGGASLRGMRD